MKKTCYVVLILGSLFFHSIGAFANAHDKNLQDQKEIIIMERAFYCAFLAEGNKEIEGNASKAAKLFGIGVDTGRSFYNKNPHEAGNLFDEMGADKMTSDIAIGIWIMKAVQEVDKVLKRSLVGSFDVERYKLFRQYNCAALI